MKNKRTKKENLIKDIEFFFINNEIDGSVDLTEINRNFETSTGTEEGAIEIFQVRRTEFTYTPAGHDDEMESYYEVLSEDDHIEILDALDDYKTDSDKTMERARG